MDNKNEEKKPQIDNGGYYNRQKSNNNDDKRPNVVKKSNPPLRNSDRRSKFDSKSNSDQRQNRSQKDNSTQKPNSDQRQKPVKKFNHEQRFKVNQVSNQDTKKKYDKKGINKKYNNVLFSIVIPLYNEEDSLPELSLQLNSELKNIPNLNNNYEIIFVDDGSTDNSFDVLKKIKQRNPNVKAIRFRRNYGKSAALSVGFEMARGMVVGTMDADLQDDPGEFKAMINKLNKGFDVVSGWKKKRYDPITKTMPSRLFNIVTSFVSGIKLHDFNCGIKVYRKDVVKSLQVYGEMHRYLPALANWDGFKVTELPVKHHPRRYGKSKFGFSRLIKGYLDLLTFVFTTRYLKRPLHFFGTIGSVVALSGFALDLYLSIEWFFGKTYLTNRPSVLLGLALIFVGVQFISIGLIGELIAKNFLDKKNYHIKERI